MNAEQLLAHFERISEAPDAIALLRRFILDLAVRGKLVEQDPEDEPAEELLAHIAKARFSLIQSGKRKKQNQLFGDHDDEPFELPNCWQWARLPEIADFSAGRTPARSEDRFWNPGLFHWVSIGDMEDGRPLSATKELVSKLAGEAVFRSEPEPVGTMIMSFKLTIGKMARLAVPAFHNEAIISIHPYLESLDPYLFKVIPIFARSADSKGAIKGATLNRDSISRIPIPLPPLAEQHRIVAKVNELMALCDQLEAARQVQEEGRELLVAATLQRLNQPSEDLASFRQDASFALQVLPSLTTTPAQIKQLRQTILNLAVRGKLVEQDPEDEPAEELLNFITKHKRASLPSTSDESSFPFELPTGWVHTTLRSLVESSCSGWSPKTLDSPREGDEWGILKVSAVSWDRFRPEANKQVLPGTQPRPQAVVRKGDFLISRANTAELVARAVVIDSEPVNLMMSDKIVRLELAELCEPKYILINNNHTSFARSYYAGRATGVSPSMKNVTRDVILDLPVPLPPLAEQHRIVAKVDELMALCDQLEQQLSQADQQRRRLLETVLAEALEEPEQVLAAMT